PTPFRRRSRSRRPYLWQDVYPRPHLIVETAQQSTTAKILSLIVDSPKALWKGRSMSDNAILVEGLHKSFGEVHAVKAIDLEVERGTVYGLLGPNGAGKTTTVRVLTTILQPDEGTASVLGIDVASDPQAVRERIGLAGQYAAIDENLTGREN